MQFIEESEEIKKLNEMYVNVLPSLSPRVTNSIYYNKLKFLMFQEIIDFCKEKLELKADLLNLRTYIGEYLSEQDITEYLDSLKSKYNNNKDIQNIGLEYHMEITRLDYGVVVFALIKRDDIYVKKFVFRFRKNPVSGLDIGNLSSADQPLPENTKHRKKDDPYTIAMKKGGADK